MAREFGLARKTIGKMLEYSLPPGYRRRKPIRRPKLGPWQGVIDAILEEDKQRPKKQRHTAKRIFERLRAEHGYGGGYTIVKDYVRAAKIGGQEILEQYRPWRLTVAHSEFRNGRIQRSGQLGYGCSGGPSAASPVQDFEEPFASSARQFALKY